MQWHWVLRIHRFYLQFIYKWGIVLGYVNFRIELRQEVHARRNVWLHRFQVASNLLTIALVFRAVVELYLRALKVVPVIGIEVYLPAFTYIVAINIMIVVVVTLQRFRPAHLTQILKDFLKLQQQVAELMQQVMPACEPCIYKAAHMQVYLLFISVVTTHYLIVVWVAVRYLLKEFTMEWLGYCVQNILYNFYPTWYSLLFFNAALMFDALCQRLAAVLTLQSNGNTHEERVIQAQSRKCLLRLHRWLLDFNQLSKQISFLFYTMMFMDALTDFYVTFADIFNDHLPATDYLFLMLKLMQPFMMHWMAERACKSFKYAALMSDRISRRRRSPLTIEEHLLQLYAQRISFRCGTMFNINRGLTLVFYAQIISYIITMVQFNLEK